MNQKPLPANKQMSGILSTTNLSKNAQLYLFPIRDQKLLFMSKEKHSTFANVQFSLKVCEVKNPPIFPIKQKSTEVSETANNFTPTKSKTDEKPAQKTTPKKDGKEEKKESKLQTKKSFGRKSEILSGPH
jgi:tyrosyl-tRNA synthetase